MSAILTFIGSIIIISGFVFLLAFTYIGIQFFLFFYWRKCKHCHRKNMEYKGLREDSANGHYLFHCPKCGAWEEVPREAFFRQCDNPISEN